MSQPGPAGRAAEEVEVLALAPELESRYERLFAYLQDDVTRFRIVDEAYRFVTEDLTCEKMVRRIVVHAQSIRRMKNIIS